MRNQKGVNIKTDIKGLFRKWMVLTQPFHKLAPREQELLAVLLYYHYQFKKTTRDENVIWKMVFDYSTKAKIKEELNMTDGSLQTMLTKLRKKNIIKNNRIVRTFIPELSDNAMNFKIVYNLILTDNGKR